MLTQIETCGKLQTLLKDATTAILLIGTNDNSHIRSSTPPEIVVARLNEITDILFSRYNIGTIAILKPPLKRDQFLNNRLEIRWREILEKLSHKKFIQFHEVNWQNHHTGRDGIHLSNTGISHLEQYVSSIRKNKKQAQMSLVKIGNPNFSEIPEVGTRQKPEVRSLMPSRKRAVGTQAEVPKPEMQPNRKLIKMVVDEVRRLNQPKRNSRNGRRRIKRTKKEE